MGIFSFLKRQKADRQAADSQAAGTAAQSAKNGAPEQASEQAAAPELDQKLQRTRSRFTENLLGFLRGKKPVDEELLEELEAQLIMADVGVAATGRVISALEQRAKRDKLKDSDEVRTALREELVNILQPVEQPLEIPDTITPFVILIVGVNGAGKTTTIGKLAKQLQDGGKSVMLAAGDTFRAAAIEQLQTWGERNNVPVIAQDIGSDSASVIFDALKSAQARGIDVLIADTAGRLHTQSGLMDELRKVKRVLAKIDPSAPHETMIVLDGGTGQNALSQAEQFNEAMDLDGLVITKLDGTAKGGVVFAIAEKMGLPIRFIGVGEKVADLEVFEADRFVDALINNGPEGDAPDG